MNNIKHNCELSFAFFDIQNQNFQLKSNFQVHIHNIAIPTIRDKNTFSEPASYNKIKTSCHGGKDVFFDIQP